MISGLLSHLLQSTLFAGAAWLLTFALRKNRAQVRFWISFTASAKFLVPFAILVSLGALIPRQTTTPQPAAWVDTIAQMGEPLVVPAVAAQTALKAATAASPIPWEAIALAAWLCGFGTVLVCWLVRWRRVRVLRRSANPLALEFPVPVMSAPGLLEPGVFGIFRPVLLFPEGILERLHPAELDAILAHEACHVRRHDNLTAAIHMAVQAIFWFHPLVWWLGARLVEERERACDEEVLAQGNTPRAYAAGILNVCRHYVESPLVCVAGVTGSNLRRRIEEILANRKARRLNYARKIALAGTALTAIFVPIAIGSFQARVMEGQAAATQVPGIQSSENRPDQSAPDPPEQETLQTPAAQAQTRPAAVAAPKPIAAPPDKFEVASIKPCKAIPAGRAGGGGQSPGRLHVNCETVRDLIRDAYDLLANGQMWRGMITSNSRTLPIDGGPGWINSERYYIDAETEAPITQEMMRGPMMRTLLEDRFKLRVRRETRQGAVYELRVAQGGPKLEPMENGSCTPIEDFDWRKLEPGQKPPLLCNGAMVQSGKLVFTAMTVADFCQNLTWDALDRPVIDKTGIAGKFNFRVEFAPDEATPFFRSAGRDPAGAPTDPVGPSIFTALQQQLGLKLESARGPVDFLVIDHIERPSEN